MENDLFISCEIWTEAKNVSKIFHDVCKRIDDKNYDISRYTENIESIGIIINCFPNELLIDGWGNLVNILVIKINMQIFAYLFLMIIL